MRTRIKAQNPEANLRNYQLACRNFSSSAEEKNFSWSTTGLVNITYEAIDRWADDPRKARQTALIFDHGGLVTSFTFKELREASSRLARLLSEEGLRIGDLLLIYLPPGPDIFIALLAAGRLGLVFALLPASAPENEVTAYLDYAFPRAVLTDPALAERYRRISRSAIPNLKHIFLTTRQGIDLDPRVVVLSGTLDHLDPDFPPVRLETSTPFYLVFAPRTTVQREIIIYSHGDMLRWLTTGRDVLDLTPNTILWTDGESGGVRSTIYAGLSPWLNGATSVVCGQSFSAIAWYRFIEAHRVAVWYTRRDYLEKLRAAGDDLPKRFDLSSLRLIAVTGGVVPLDLFFWVKSRLNLSPHNNWWSSETGMISLANFPALDLKPGSFGMPVPGVEAAVMTDTGEPLPILSLGRLAIKKVTSDSCPDPSSPAIEEDRWLYPGELAVLDEDGYYFPYGRLDDLVQIGDRLIGPFDLEPVLTKHPAVLEAVVIAKSASSSAPVFKAFIVLKPGLSPTDQIQDEIAELFRLNLPNIEPILEIAFRETLPKTPNGHVIRLVLRAEELGLPAGDLTKLADTD